MNLIELNPFIRYAKIQYPPFSSRKEPSICYDARFFYVENACGTLLVNGTEYKISDYCAIYLPPLSRYLFSLAYTAESRISTFDFDLTAEHSEIESSLGVATDESFNETLVPCCKMLSSLASPILRPLPEICGQVGACVRDFSMRLPLYRERASSHLKLALLSLLSENEGCSVPSLCLELCAYVRAHASDPLLTNESIAAALHYSSHHLNRLLKEAMGVSLHEYVISARLEMAKDLLEGTNLSVCEIAFRSGFSSAAHFSKVFRESQNCTPKEYRRLHLRTEI